MDGPIGAIDSPKSSQISRYGTAHLQGNECPRETRTQLSSNSRVTLVCTQSYSQSSIQQNPVKITNCWVGENINDWITLHSSTSVLFRKMRSIDRNGGRVRLAIYIVLGELRLNLCKMCHKIHCKDRLQACYLLAN